ncbi:AAA family ATPase [Bradyrhizobium diazoefficiens]
MADAARFLQLLDPSATKFEFRTFDDNKARKDKTLTRTFYGTLAEHAAELQRLNDKGAGVFVVINETDGKGRETENIVRVRALFIDIDGGTSLETVHAAKLKPHIVVNSSPGKAHVYWRVDGMALDDFTPAEEALIETFDSDPEVKALAGILRLPGFCHCKAEPFLVHIIEALDAPAYPAAYFKLAKRPPRRPVDDDIEVNPDKAIAALNEARNDDVDEDTWFRLMASAWRAGDGAEEVYQAFVRWSKRSPKHNDKRTRQRWRAFGRKPAREISPATLYDHADETARGWRDRWQRAMMEEAFAPLPDDDTPAARATFDQKQRDDDHTDKEPPKSKAPLHDWIETSDEFAANFEPPDYLIEGWLQRRFVYSLTGMTGSGKTCIAMRIAAHNALGLDIDGRKVEKGRVLFLAGENPDDVRMRWIKLCEELKKSPAEMDLYFLPRALALSDPVIRKRINLEAAKHGPFSLIIVDTNAAYFSGDDENNNVQMGNHARMLRSLVNLPGGPSIIVTCHPIKAANVDNLLPRGGGAFLNEVDGNLTCARSNMTVTVHWHGKFRGPEFAPLHFQLQAGSTDLLKDSKGQPIWTITAAPLTENEASVMADTARNAQDQLLALLQQFGGKLSLAAMAEKLGWCLKSGDFNRGLVHRTLASLLEERLIKKTRGEYELTAAGKDAVARMVPF